MRILRLYACILYLCIAQILNAPRLPFSSGIHITQRSIQQARPQTILHLFVFYCSTTPVLECAFSFASLASNTPQTFICMFRPQALMAMNVAPGLMRRVWPFHTWHDFNPELWSRCCEDARSRVRADLHNLRLVVRACFQSPQREAGAPREAASVSRVEIFTIFAKQRDLETGCRRQA